MRWEGRVPVNFGDMLEGIAMPPMVHVRQHFPADRIPDPAAETRDRMNRLLADGRAKGKRVAITAGSRGIRHIPAILRAVADTLRAHGADPFLVPAMGSHGGATPEGQVETLRHLGITGENVGAPIVATMDTRQVGALADGTPVHLSADALDADGVVAVNKVKPHADFKGEYESGLVKMLAIGLGKHRGCAALHTRGFARFPQVLPAAAALILREVNVLGGLAIVENAYDEILLLEAVEPGDILRREKDLLALAKDHVARLKVDELDVLIIDEIGKHISGEGMDPNVTGRPGSYLNDGFDHLRAGIIVVRDVAAQSAGNGAGIGMADITTVACARKLDLAAMYTNSITAGILGPARLPVVLANDEEALKTALRIGAARNAGAPRVARIQNTLHLDDIWVSEALLPQLRRRADVTILENRALEFDAHGMLLGQVGG